MLAEALFWLDRPQESVEVRHAAYAAHADRGDHTAAAMAAWQLYFDHALVGETVMASGWLRRARRHVPTDGSAADGFVALAEADRAHGTGDLAEALEHAGRAVAIGRRSRDDDLLAMALQTQGRLLLATGHVDEGVLLLDDAMLSVVAGGLRPLITGWVYCAVLGACHDIADLRRAAQWTDAALRWSDGLDGGLLYPGLCRIHRVELACLQGSWATAEREARRACDELLAHDPRYAGDAVYLAADLQRLRGDLAAAEAGFRRAHELGREPQPGLALVWLAQGRPAAAVAALRLSLQPGPSAPMARAVQLAALVEAEVALGEVARATAAVEELRTLAEQTASPYLQAVALACNGRVRLAGDDGAAALVALRDARTSFQELSMPYEMARVQVQLALALERAGDHETAAMERSAAEATFRRLRREGEEQPVPPGPLTGRELEVLRLVARGRTNRQVAGELVLSEHTVGRHLSNIFTKLGVSSRAAATSYAYEHDLF